MIGLDDAGLDDAGFSLAGDPMSLVPCHMSHVPSSILMPVFLCEYVYVR